MEKIRESFHRLRATVKRIKDKEKAELLKLMPKAKPRIGA